METTVALSANEIMSAIESLDGGATLSRADGGWCVKSGIWVTGGVFTYSSEAKASSPDAALRAWWKKNVEDLPPGNRLIGRHGGYFRWDGLQFAPA